MTVIFHTVSIIIIPCVNEIFMSSPQVLTQSPVLIPVFFRTHNFPIGYHSCGDPPSTTVKLFGILAEWLHSHHLGPLTERTSASGLTCSWFSASAGFWCPTRDGSMTLAELSIHTHTLIISAFMHVHIHIYTHHTYRPLTAVDKHWRSHTSLSLSPSLLEFLSAFLLTSPHLFLLACFSPVSCQPPSSHPSLVLDTATGEVLTQSLLVLFHTQITQLHKELLCLGTSAGSLMLGLIKHVLRTWKSGVKVSREEFSQTPERDPGTMSVALCLPSRKQYSMEGHRSLTLLSNLLAFGWEIFVWKHWL